MSLNVFKPSPDIEPLRAQNSLLSESDYPLSLTQRAILERRILLEKELGPVQYQHSSLQEQLDQTEQLIDMYKNSSQLSEYVEHHTQLLSQRQKIQEIYNAKFEMLKALDKQLPDFYRSELTKESSLSSVLPAASSTVSSSTHAPLQLMHTISPKRFLPHPIPFPARPADLSKPCRCPLCPRSFLHNGGLRVHIERYHTENYEQIRAILRSRLHQETSSIIRKGRRIDLLQLSRDCLPTISNICGASFQVNFLFALLKDMRKIEKPRSAATRTSHDGLPGAGSCSSTSLSNASASLQHQPDSGPSIAAGPTCPVCKATFVQLLEMLHHMRRDHLGVRRRQGFSCSICKYELSDADALAAHMALHQVTVAGLARVFLNDV